ncbi:uncharacterized protein BJ212DRAFT_1580536 [Suillus subaureus]|uniref:Uncharacterized protein n=1 Tax=Suillus subaureus TaxID=48587 RepID=A0A9P7J764_9AGAM|nr:uncharacterized protein BJ212DRAFT_1580536 [Suillus subaureus]KAG1806171.1 hypothetical protein BJ212DRAFT_1580536 [Suillus subaureus]
MQTSNSKVNLLTVSDIIAALQIIVGAKVLDTPLRITTIRISYVHNLRYSTLKPRTPEPHSLIPITAIELKDQSIRAIITERQLGYSTGMGHTAGMGVTGMAGTGTV